MIEHLFGAFIVICFVAALIGILVGGPSSRRRDR